MRIFITGGTGFIGPYVVNRLLQDEHTLLLLSYEEEELNADYFNFPEKVQFVTGNLSNIEDWKAPLEEFNPDLAIHMGWEGIPDFKSRMCVRNLQYGLNLYLNLAEIGCRRLLTTGSCWEYGQKIGKLNEEMHPKPSNAFTAAKNALRLMGKEIAKEYGLQFIWTRLFYVYGPRQKPNSLLPYILNSVLKNEVPQVKTPDSKNDFVFVKDVADAMALIVEKCHRNQMIYNIGSGYSTSVREIIKLTYELCNIPMNEDIFSKSQPETEKVDFWADITKINSDLGWKPKITISKGIERMLEFYRLV